MVAFSITIMSIFAMVASSNVIMNLMAESPATADEPEEEEVQAGLWTTSELGIDKNAPPSYAASMRTSRRNPRRGRVLVLDGEAPPPSYETVIRSTPRTA